MISTILLLPHAETRERLLAPGAPVAYRDAMFWYFGWGVIGCNGTPGVSWPDIGDVPLFADDQDHLVLARSGAVVPEGVDRLCRVEREAQPANGWWATHDLEDALRNIMAGTAPNPVPPEAFPLGTLLLLDSEGNVVTP